MLHFEEPPAVVLRVWWISFGIPPSKTIAMSYQPCFIRYSITPRAVQDNVIFHFNPCAMAHPFLQTLRTCLILPCFSLRLWPERPTCPSSLSLRKSFLPVFASTRSLVQFTQAHRANRSLHCQYKVHNPHLFNLRRSFRNFCAGISLQRLNLASQRERHPKKEAHLHRTSGVEHGTLETTNVVNMHPLHHFFVLPLSLLCVAPLLPSLNATAFASPLPLPSPSIEIHTLPPLPSSSRLTTTLGAELDNRAFDVEERDVVSNGDLAADWDAWQIQWREQQSQRRCTLWRECVGV